MFAKTVSLFTIFTVAASFLYATPSTQIWNPSTDLQAPWTLHLGIDNYFTLSKNGYGLPTDLGLTFGIPFLEVGVDMFQPSDDPFYFNAKAGLSEDLVFTGFPALAAGVFSVGMRKNVNDYNIVYGLLAKTVGPLGRFSAGYFSGNSALLLDPEGNADNKGVILCWDRVMGELSDKLWLCVDYAGTKSFYGSLSFGFSWAFAPHAALIVGYDIYNNKAKDTLTTQLDINL